MASVPSWKQALLEKKRRQEEDDRSRFQHEQKRLAEMPSWKRELLLKKKKIHDSAVPGGDKNMVIIESSHKASEGINGRSYYPEFSGSQRTTPDSGFDESEEAAHRAGHPAYIQESRWVQVNSTKSGHSHLQRSQHDTPDAIPVHVRPSVVENGVETRVKGAKRDSDDELPYQPGFVHKLLDKFSHMTVNERMRRVSQGGTEYSDDSGGSAKSSPRYETDSNKHHPSQNLRSSKENLFQDAQIHISSEEKVHKDCAVTSKEEKTISKEAVTIERIENIPGEGKVVIVSSSSLIPNQGASIPNGTVPTDASDGKVTVISGKEEKGDESLVKNIVSSVRNIFEGSKRRAAPPAPKIAAVVRQSHQAQNQNNHTPVNQGNDQTLDTDNVQIIPSQARPPNSVNVKVVSQTQSEGKSKKSNKQQKIKKGTPDSDTIQKIRDAGQSWLFGNDAQGNEQMVDNGATVASSGGVAQGPREMVNIGRRGNESSSMVEVTKKVNAHVVQETRPVELEPVFKERPKPEPPRNIEIKLNEPVKAEKKRVIEPPKTVEIISKSRVAPTAPSSSSSGLTMVEVKVKNKSKGSVIIAPTAPGRKRQAPPAPPSVSRSAAPPPPKYTNNEPKHFVKVENVTTGQSIVDSGKIIITDTEDDEIPVTNIDDMLFDDDDDIDIVDVKSRKVAPPSGIDTHLDLSSIVNEEREIKVVSVPSPVRPCNISFVGECVKLDKSLLIRTRSKDGRSLRFKESISEIHEYPSELTMMSFFPEENMEATMQSNISDDETDEEPDRPTDVTDNNMMSSSNTAVGSSGGVLGSYKGRFVGDYQLGSAPMPSNRPLAQRIIQEPEPEEEEDDMHMRPADEDETFAWSETTNSDMLF